MEEVDYLLSLLLIAPILLAFANWATSLIMTHGKENYTLVDLRQLWLDSLPFLKAQWLIVGVTIAATTWQQLQPTQGLTAKLDATTLLSIFGASGILWILGLFYVSYLAMPKHPNRVSTIGFWSLTMYVIGDMAISVLGSLGILLFVVPGLIVFVRSCLFLPAYAIQGSHSLSAIKHSWALTKNKYWLVSRYMGLPALGLVASIVYPTIVEKFVTNHTLVEILNYLPLTIVLAASTQVFSLAICGLLYKLYDRLSTEEQQTIT
ncbi:MAG: hypothetical protein WC714_25200 [Candidatus Obscuribacterales bacterium]|jgi:hypothetical protein